MYRVGKQPHHVNYKKMLRVFYYEHGRTAFMFACTEGSKDIVQMLVDNANPNIELNTPDDYGITPLMMACMEADKDVVQLLLNHSDKSIELNARDHNGRTALMYARASMDGPNIFRPIETSKDIVKLLLEHS